MNSKFERYVECSRRYLICRILNFLKVSNANSVGTYRGPEYEVVINVTNRLRYPYKHKAIIKKV